MNAGRQRPAAARATGGGLRVRAARRADADAVAVLVAEFAEYLRALGDPTDFRFDGASFVRDGFGRGALFHALVVLRARQLVGYLLWHDGYDSDRALRLVHVIDLFVTASERGHGIGRQLMEEVARRARRRGPRPSSRDRRQAAAPRCGRRRRRSAAWRPSAASSGRRCR